MGEELRLPGAGTGETGAWRGQALRKRDSSWLCRDPHAKASHAEGSGAVPKVPTGMCWCEGAFCLATGLYELDRRHRGAEQGGQVGNEVFKWVFCGVCAPCWPTSVLPPDSFSGLPVQPLWLLSPLPGGVDGMDRGWLLSSDPKVRWALGGWWGRAATPHPLPPLLWLRSSQHSLSW